MRVRYTAAALAVAALALAGCGHPVRADNGGQSTGPATTEQPSPQRVLADAARRTLAAGTAHYSLEVHSSVQGLAPSTARATGVIDFRRSRSQLDMIFESSGRKLKFRVIYDRGMLYEKLPPELAGTSRKPWLKLDLTATLGGASSQLNVNDPGGLVAFLYGADAVRREAGIEMVRGVPTTCYTGSLDPRRAAGRLPPEYRGQYMDSLEGVGAAGPIPATLWVDRHGMIRRIQLVRKATVQGKLSTSRTAVEYFDFGEPVNIKLPPPDQVQ